MVLMGHSEVFVTLGKNSDLQKGLNECGVLLTHKTIGWGNKHTLMAKSNAFLGYFVTHGFFVSRRKIIAKLKFGEIVQMTI